LDIALSYTPEPFVVKEVPKGTEAELEIEKNLPRPH